MMRRHYSSLLYLHDRQVYLLAFDPNGGHNALSDGPPHPMSFLSSAISKFPNLRSINTYQEYQHLKRSPKIPHLGKDAPTPFASRLQRDILLKNPFLHSSNINHQHQPSQITLPLQRLFQALRNWTPKQSHLTIDALPWPYWKHSYRPSNQFAHTNASLITPFSNLQSLNIRLCVGLLNPDSTWPKPEPVARQIRNFPARAKNVEVLRLQFQVPDKNVCSIPGWDPDQRIIDVSPIFESLTFNRLKELTLNSCGFHPMTFANFMLRHASSLTMFSVNQLETVDERGRWRPAMEKIARGMTLTSVSIALLRDEEMAGKVREDLMYEDDGVDWQNLQAFNDGVARFLMRWGRIEYPTWGESGHQR